jgi:hypothetical protein
MTIEEYKKHFENLRFGSSNFDRMVSLARSAIEELADLEKQLDEAKAEIVVLKELVDGASDIVEIYSTVSPGQLIWKRYWLEKAREALQEEK